MSHQAIHVQAAARLHFGLFAFGRHGAEERNFGGVGMMIAQPHVALSISPADEFAATGLLARRVKTFARQWCERLGSELPDCEVKVETAPPEHSGFGVGTQLGLSVVAGLNALSQRDPMNAEELADVTDRGARSAVGVYGFLRGGLIVEDGKLPGESLSPLLERLPVPGHWRVVLLRPRDAFGISGLQEQSAFAELPPVTAGTSHQLREEVSQRMLPALRSEDFGAFSRSVTTYGEIAGGCFAAAQGGPYNGETLTHIVKQVRELGVEGVGQSSWGPTIYCLLPNQSAAEVFVDRARGRLGRFDVEISVTQPCNQGAIVKTSRRANPKAVNLSCSLSPDS